MVMKGDLRVLAEQTVAWRQKVPPVRKERGVRVDIDAVAEHTESHARTKKTGVCVFVCVRGGGVCVCVWGTGHSKGAALHVQVSGHRCVCVTLYCLSGLFWTQQTINEKEVQIRMSGS